jgi:DNA-binding IscR family transcriptional regulator
MLHILIHMDGREAPLTSQEAARMLDTNAVVVRRTMAGLRDAGHVCSERGHGGGWTLSHDLDQITVLDVYRAVGEPRIFSIGPANPSPQCLVEQAVNDSMATALRDAEKLLIDHFAGVTLADIAADFDKRLAALGLTRSVFPASGAP